MIFNALIAFAGLWHLPAAPCIPRHVSVSNAIFPCVISCHAIRAYGSCALVWVPHLQRLQLLLAVLLQLLPPGSLLSEVQLKLLRVRSGARHMPTHISNSRVVINYYQHPNMLT